MITRGKAKNTSTPTSPTLINSPGSVINPSVINPSVINPSVLSPVIEEVPERDDPLGPLAGLLEKYSQKISVESRQRKKLDATQLRFETALSEFYGDDDLELRLECDKPENWKNSALLNEMCIDLEKINAMTKNKSLGMVKLLETPNLSIEKKQEISESIAGLVDMEPFTVEYRALCNEIHDATSIKPPRERFPEELREYYDKIMDLQNHGCQELSEELLKQLQVLKGLLDTEYAKKKEWFDNILAIPFGKYATQDTDIHRVIGNARKCLDENIIYLEEAKDEVLSFILKFIQTPSDSHEPISLAIHGSPGVGKTSLVRQGISRALNRPFHCIALGGAKDSTILLGNSFTYTGSICGKIVEILKKSKVMNPIIYFDELDKISGTPEGQEIISVLTHIIDPSQNRTFHDNYIGGVDIDLSKVIFIFSYNHSERLDSILSDRINKIQIKDPTTLHKKEICKRHLIPKLLEGKGFKVEFKEDAMNYLISLTNEKGCREIKRHLDHVISRVNIIYNGLTEFVRLDYKNTVLKIVEGTEGKTVILDSDSTRLLIREKISNNSTGNKEAQFSMYS